VYATSTGTRRPGPVQGEQREPGDDRRQREGQVDDRVDDPLAAEVVADEDPRDERAEHDVDERHDERHDEREDHRGARLPAADLLPEAGEAALHRLDGDRGERDEHDEREVRGRQGRPGEGGGPATHGKLAGRGRGERAHPVATPRSSKISARNELCGSKKLVRDPVHPPNRSISNRPDGVGKRASSASAGRIER
jgi:hypothetical protein